MSSKHIAIAVSALVLVVASFMAGRISVSRGDAPESERTSASRSYGGSQTPAYPTAGRTGKGGDSRRNEGGSSSKESRARAQEGSSGGQPGEGPELAAGQLSRAEQLLEKKGLPLFDENYELNPELGKTLGLSKPELARLNQTLRNTLDEVDTLREQSIEVRSRSDSQMFMKIRSFGEKGAEVRTALQDDLREQLGDERYSAFMLMTQDSLESEYFEFGRAYQTISYNFYTSENTGTQRVRIVDEVHIPQGDGAWTIIQNKDNYDTLPENYQSYLEIADGATRTPAAVPAGTSSTPPEPSPGTTEP